MVFANTSCSQSQKEHEFVDLGLPSGTKWATCNVGATNPEDFGDLFAWGETKVKKEYTRETYAFGTKNQQKYNTTDKNLVLQSCDDAATINWGEDWQTPTLEQFEELLENCKLEWTEKNNIGRQLITGPNGNSIFLPAAGNTSDLSFSYSKPEGFYWSASADPDQPIYVKFLTISSDYNDLIVGDTRNVGMSVRPVRKQDFNTLKTNGYQFIDGRFLFHAKLSLLHSPAAPL